ncbi:NAC domain containing protein 70, partial [Striga asiatica]
QIGLPKFDLLRPKSDRKIASPPSIFSRKSLLAGEPLAAAIHQQPPASRNGPSRAVERPSRGGARRREKAADVRPPPREAFLPPMSARRTHQTNCSTTSTVKRPATATRRDLSETRGLTPTRASNRSSSHLLSPAPTREPTSPARPQSVHQRLRSTVGENIPEQISVRSPTAANHCALPQQRTTFANFLPRLSTLRRRRPSPSGQQLADPVRDCLDASNREQSRLSETAAPRQPQLKCA